jgi:hypothetical protein
MSARGQSAEGPGAFRRPPPPDRPDSPGEDYGTPREGGTMVDWSFVLELLGEARSYWLCSVSADGRPHAAPVWGALVDDDLYLETSPQTKKARNIARNPKVSVHVEEGDHAVIVEGEAVPARPLPVVGRSLAAEFTRKYAGYEPGAGDWDGGGLYRLLPEKVLAWRDMPTAARWRFPR